MKYINTLLGIEATLVVGMIGLAGYLYLTLAVKPIEKNDKPKLTILKPQINAEGPVSVTVIPPSELKDSSVWIFGVTLDTHSGNLSQDVAKSALLSDNNGKEYKPVSWEGDAPEGHHRKGVLKFSPIIPRPASIKLNISKVGGIEERTFMWTL